MNEKIVILREAITKITQLLAGNGIRVSQRGISASVTHDASGKPVEVNLPYLPDNCPESLISAIQGFLDKEVAHLLFTDYQIANQARLAGCADLFNIIEDIYVEKAMAKRFNGSAHNISVMRDFFVDKYLTFEVKKAQAAGHEAALSKLLVTPLFRAAAHQSEFVRFMSDASLQTVMQPMSDRLGGLLSEVEKVNSSAESFELAKQMLEALKGSSGKGKEEKEGGEATSKTKQEKGKGEGKSEPKDPSMDSTGADGKTKGEEKNPEGEGEGEGEESDKDGEEGEEGEAGEGDESPEDDTEADADTEGEEAEGDDDTDDEPLEGEQQEARSFGDEVDYSEEEAQEASGGGDGGDDDESSEGEGVYREGADLSAMTNGAPNMSEVVAHIASKDTATAAKESPYLVYTKDNDKIEPFDISKGYTKYNDSMMVALEDSVSHMVAPLQKDIERSIAAKSQSTWQAGQRRGKLNASGLARLATNDDRVFRRKEISTSKDVAVELVIDCSGSMNGHKIVTASQAAYALAQVLERLNIQNEIIGFTTGEDDGVNRSKRHADESKMGRSFSRTEALIMPIFKGFEERLNTETKRRLAYLPHWGELRNNVDGECIEIAYHRLMRRTAHRKIMIVLSDGSPASHGSYHDVNEHLKTVVRGIEKTKVDIIGIGICSDSVEKFYKKNVVIHNVKDLPGKVMGELKKMLMAGIH